MPRRDWTGWWRHAALAGLGIGLFASPSLPAPAGWAPCAFAGAGALFAAARSRTAAPGPAAAVGALVAIALVAAVAGLGLGRTRLDAIDAGALRAAPGERLAVTGWVTAQPRRAFGEVRVQVDTDAGRLVVVAPEPVSDLAVGQAVSARGVLREPDDFRAAELARAGAAFELAAGGVRPVPGSRAGLAGAIDGIRSRAESALGVGLDPAEEALARGFVLGQDDRIDPLTREQFRRAGLSHLLAVSGQNVVLLAILAGVGLALFGLGLRARLAATVLLIALYVPVAGAGPSIQRAGVMGAAAILATLAGRLSGRAYPPLLAAALTLLVNPRFGGDVGWQLSFAAVAGIMLWAGPARELIAERLPSRLPDALARGLADGAAMTLAATVATAPLIASDFERISLASIPANLLVLPAVAPVMWIGMLTGLLAQIPGVPTAPLGFVEGALIDWIALVARVLGSPGWAEAEVGGGSPAAVAVAYLAASAAAAVILATLRRRRRLAIAPAARVAAGMVALAALTFALTGSSSGARSGITGLRVTALDVGQGDATLLERPRGAPVLIDAGPPGGAAAAALDRLGVDSLAAVFVTHDQLDHAGGLREVLAGHRVEVVVRGRPAPAIDAAARAAGARVVAASEGSALRFGALRIDVLWPPREDAGADPDPNAGSLVLAAGWHGWDVLLTGDAEAEATHLVPGPFDVLKVAHHGSEDAGLDSLLDRSVPRVALIEVGADNTYGHPTPATLTTLAEHGICTLRTDLDGDASVDLTATGVAVATARGSGTAGRPGCAPER
ncbi:MAG: ComEC/Rec2 family competence protein [Solirubrobacterales bacterium]